MSTASLYKYKALPDSRSIRLLSLQGAQHGDPLSCVLVTHSLDQCPPFRALSYTWGSPFPEGYDDNNTVDQDIGHKPFHIWCEDAVLPIGQNLYEALFQIRETFQDVILWIDAICIDQGNDQERSTQVMLMGDVYSTANEVLVWLGREDEHARRALKLHESLGSVLEYFWHDDHVDDWSLYPFNSPEFYDKFGIEQPLFESWRSYSKFYQRTWFERTWIIQEITLARKVTTMCGAMTWDWRLMNSFATFMRISHWGLLLQGHLGVTELQAIPGTQFLGNSMLADSFRKNGLQAYQPRMYREYMCGGKDAKAIEAYLEWLLIHVRTTRASDPRDKVFGILGLLANLFEPEKIHLKADYSLSTVKVYTRTATHLILELPFLSLLSAVEDEGDRKIVGLPSWVPDFTARHVQLFVTSGQGKYWDAATAIRNLPSVDTYIQGDILHLNAVHFDTTADCCEPMMKVVKQNAIVNMLSRCLKMETMYINGQSRTEALWRTLIADCTEKHCPAPRDIGKSFRHWLRDLLAIAFLNALAHTTDSSGLVVRYQSLVDLLSSHDLPSLSEIQVDMDFRLQFFTGNNSKKKVFTFGALAEPFLKSFSTMTQKRLFLSQKGFLGLCPMSAEIGDSIWIFRSAKVPFLLRRMPGNKCFKLVGEVYLHGFMNGEIGRTFPAGPIEQISIQ